MGEIKRKVWLSAPGTTRRFSPRRLMQVDTGADWNVVPLDVAKDARLNVNAAGWDVINWGGKIVGKLVPAILETENCRAVTEVFVPLGYLPRVLDARPFFEQIVAPPPNLFLLGHPFLQATGARLDFGDDSLACPAPRRRAKRAA